MRRLLALPLILILLLGTPAFADYQKALDAYESGDYATAVKEWKPLAEQGDADAQFYLGVMYDMGQGVTQDYKAAVKWYQLAADQGGVPAQLNLGHMYYLGKGVTQDYKAAVKWYQLAADQGVAIAQSNLGIAYYLGQGVIQDYTRAHMWLNIAASQGDKNGAKGRDIAAKKMTPTQIEKAQNLARECVAKNYKGC